MTGSRVAVTPVDGLIERMEALDSPDPDAIRTEVRLTLLTDLMAQPAGPLKHHPRGRPRSGPVDE